MFCKKGAQLEILQNSQENTCARDSFLIKLLLINFNKKESLACKFIKKESLAQVFSCEFCEYSHEISPYMNHFNHTVIQSDQLKVSEYPFKQNKNMSKNMAVPLYTYFYNISLNTLRLTFFSIYNLPFLRSPNIGKVRVKVGPKTNYFSYILRSGTNRIVVLNNFFSLICSPPRDR